MVVKEKMIGERVNIKMVFRVGIVNMQKGIIEREMKEVYCSCT